MERKIIREGNHFIKADKLEALQQLFLDCQSLECYVDWCYIFKELFVNSVIHNRLLISKWLYEQYHKLDDIQKIALRPVFKYVKYLKKNNKLEDLAHIKWFKELVEC